MRSARLVLIFVFVSPLLLEGPEADAPRRKGRVNRRLVGLEGEGALRPQARDLVIAGASTLAPKPA